MSNEWLEFTIYSPETETMKVLINAREITSIAANRYMDNDVTTITLNGSFSYDVTENYDTVRSRICELINR